jgi:ABC-2 type transport system permease protein
VWLEVARFELKRRMKLYSTWVYGVLLLALGVLFMLAAGGAFESASADFGKVHANAPMPIFFATAVLGIVGIFVIASIAGQAQSADYGAGMDALFFATPMKRAHYWLGRFVAAQLLLLVLFLGVPLGLYLGASVPTLDPKYFGPQRLAYYLWPYAVLIVPNIVAFGSLFFSIATLRRSMRPVHLIVILLVMGYFLAQAIGKDVDYDVITGLLDPFGLRATRVQTRYWPIAEQNDRYVALSGVLLANRLVWMGMGAFGLTMVALRFRPDTKITVQRTRESKRAISDRRAPLWLSAAALELKQMVLNVYFQAVAASGILFTAIILSNAGSEPGFHTYPVSTATAELAFSVFGPFGLAVVTIFAGDAVWRERDARMHQLYDALPMRTWQPIIAKWLGLFLSQALLLLLIAATAVCLQLARGFYAIEPFVFAKRLLFLDLPNALMLCSLAIFVQVVSPSKYAGYLMVVVYFLGTMALDKLGFEHYLYRFGEGPVPTVSDMNGYGHYAAGLFWFSLYWLLGSGLLVLASVLFARRGEETTRRFQEAKTRFMPAPFFILASAFVLTGAYIFYNTNILNRYETGSAGERRTAEYETLYKVRETLPQPKVTDVELTVALRPEQREADLSADMVLENKTTTPISVIDVLINEELQVARLELDRASTRIIDDRAHGYYALQLSTPLAPGEKTKLSYLTLIRNPGFRVRGGSTAVVENGSFIGEGFYPRIGYAAQAELSDDNARHRQSLPEKERVADLDDPQARQYNMFTRDADWFRFNATVSTAPDQIAIAPGYLKRTWDEGGRKFFRYEMDVPMQNFYAVNSGRFAVHRETHQGVNIEIFYHPAHTYNVTRMSESVKHSIATFTRLFGPYQFKQLRIVEFPRYAMFAQSFPNTVPYSEGLGFIVRVDPDDPKDIDYPYFVTAHEVAHQWWGHQVIGGDVQGAAMLCESLAEYSALLVLEEKYGEPMMRRFLRHELRGYLGGRASERKKELPLYRVENQGYIHYKKGALAFYGLADSVGKEHVNAALKRFADKTRFQTPPYTYTRELLAELKQGLANPAIVEDLFERITLYDNRTKTAVAKKRADGRYDVTLVVNAEKLTADGEGRETPGDFEQLMEIGGLDKNEKAIATTLVKVRRGEQTLSYVSETLPKKAGVDPLVKLIDRVLDDNLVSVSLED